MTAVKSARNVKRPVNELRFSVTISPPDADDDLRHQFDVDLRAMTLAERQLAKRALAKMVDPDWAEVVMVHAWVVWRRTNPTSSLQEWMDNLSFGDVLDGLDFDPEHVAWDTTPEGFDPEA